MSCPMKQLSSSLMLTGFELTQQPHAQLLLLLLHESDRQTEAVTQGNHVEWSLFRLVLVMCFGCRFTRLVTQGCAQRLFVLIVGSFDEAVGLSQKPKHTLLLLELLGPL